MVHFGVVEMRLPDFALVAVLPSAVMSASVPAQLVTATAEAISPLTVGTTFASNSAPAGTVLAPSFGVAASHSFPGGRNGLANATYQLTIASRGVTYRISQYCSITESFKIGFAECGSTSAPHHTRLTLAASQPTAGMLSIVATGSAVSGGALSASRRWIAVDIGNNGSIEWSTSAIAGGTYQQQVTVSGQLQICASAWASAWMFPNQTLDTTAVSSLVEITFQPLAASCQLRNGSGTNPGVCSCSTLPVIGTIWDIAIAPAPNTILTGAFAAVTPAVAPLPPFGELLIAPPWLPIPGAGMHSVTLPNSPAMIGFTLSVQGARLNAVGASCVLELTNAVDAVVGI